MKNKFSINDTVTINIGTDKIRWATILVFKISENEVRYDIVKEGFRFYDVPEYFLEIPSEHNDYTEII